MRLLIGQQSLLTSERMRYYRNKISIYRYDTTFQLFLLRQQPA